MHITNDVLHERDVVKYSPKWMGAIYFSTTICGFKLQGSKDGVRTFGCNHNQMSQKTCWATAKNSIKIIILLDIIFLVSL
jgi:hypothetical protein